MKFRRLERQELRRVAGAECGKDAGHEDRHYRAGAGEPHDGLEDSAGQRDRDHKPSPCPGDGHCADLPPDRAPEGAEKSAWREVSFAVRASYEEVR